ncbi:YARHG domain-containing protein [Cohaesibacter gelatinilyticus]|uniref:YARHG domain-containing protein n=1 Tax=Cohaesibacter gelatinilyticus TaxID=372072 RepID=A0A285PCW8_9HYPH|nr:YARHG domain-containing protein [Cohaesibacter gelatinilyticus]SNZ19590.1 YARHG domain-containing protein [Cohaesibacter gelatinilyticus]
MANPSNSKQSTSYEAFGACLTKLIRQRGFSSDEQLVRKAMQGQKEDGPKLTIQRRTISNWRNGKSAPRSKDDPRFQLVLDALNLSEDQQAELLSLLEKPSVTTSQEAQPQPQKPKLSGRQKSMMIGAAILGLGLVLGIPFLYSDDVPTYLSEIPEDELRLSESGFVLPASDKRAIEEKDLISLTGWELYIARNEIFARKGRPFVKDTSMCLQRHFDSWAKSADKANGWYKKQAGGLSLSDLEHRNTETIRTYECTQRGGQMTCTGKLTPCR